MFCNLFHDIVKKIIRKYFQPPLSPPFQPKALRHWRKTICFFFAIVILMFLFFLFFFNINISWTQKLYHIFYWINTKYLKTQSKILQKRYALVLKRKQFNKANEFVLKTKFLKHTFLIFILFIILFSDSALVCCKLLFFMVIVVVFCV